MFNKQPHGIKEVGKFSPPQFVIDNGLVVPEEAPKKRRFMKEAIIIAISLIVFLGASGVILYYTNIL